jgi:SAM-dependent methyltransferase
MAATMDKADVERIGAGLNRDLRLVDTIQWDVRNWSIAIRFWETHTSVDLSNSLALEIGSHHGGLSLWMAQHGAHVVCSDLNGTTHNAGELHTKHRVTELISYESIDATNIPYKDRFDIVFFKSVLGGIGLNDSKERQSRAVNEMHRALKKGGELFFAENLVASPFHRIFRRRFVKWGTEWRYVTIDEMNEFLAPFSKVKYRTIGFLGALGRTERQRAVLSWFDKHLISLLVPKSWRYIIAGVATK